MYSCFPQAAVALLYRTDTLQVPPAVSWGIYRRVTGEQQLPFTESHSSPTSLTLAHGERQEGKDHR